MVIYMLQNDPPLQFEGTRSCKIKENNQKTVKKQYPDGQHPII